MKIRQICLVVALLLLQTNMAFTQCDTSFLIPIPNKITYGNGKKHFTVNEKTVIVTDLPQESYCIKKLVHTINKYTGVTPHIKDSAKHNAITVTKDSSIIGDEHYILEVNGNGIKISGSTDGAILYGIATLEQIMQGEGHKKDIVCIPEVIIDDTPRFGYRSLMLDPARNFLPVDDIMFFLDIMAKYKYNVLQLHLTDDQGWRVEIKSHPDLTRNGKFYTQNELKKIISYAAERNIQIIPEIDIPGHTVAILAAYPELGCTNSDTIPKILGKTTDLMLCAANEKVYETYKDIISEIASIFPSNYIHLGGDEAVIKKNWALCDRCACLKDSLRYKSFEKLMGHFFNKISGFVKDSGKKCMFWYELENTEGGYEPLFDYPKNAILFSWRMGMTPTCINISRSKGNSIIMAPGEYAYIDYPQYKNDFPEFNNWGMPITTLEKCYEFDPGYAALELDTEHVIGICGTLWGEAILDINRATYMAFPRALALAEAGWSEMDRRDWEGFKTRMFNNLFELMISGVSVRVPYEVGDREKISQ